ncbi:hypothetical protein M8J76_010620 [Diaphorina citri]|nr:hypothetical protein M8J76_010620 [Diaphorina citri]
MCDESCCGMLVGAALVCFADSVTNGLRLWQSMCSSQQTVENVIAIRIADRNEPQKSPQSSITFSTCHWKMEPYNSESGRDPTSFSSLGK